MRPISEAPREIREVFLMCAAGRALRGMRQHKQAMALDIVLNRAIKINRSKLRIV